jgi:hypothetical protein
MLTAIVLVCSLATTPDLRDCTRDNAVHVLQLPEEYALPAKCFMQGQAYLAETSIGRDIAADEGVKVVCVPTHKLAPGHRVG